MQADVRWCEKVPKVLVACRDRARSMDRAMSRLRRRHWPTLHRGRRGSGGIAQRSDVPVNDEIVYATSTSSHKLPCPQALFQLFQHCAVFLMLCVGIL